MQMIIFIVLVVVVAVNVISNLHTIQLLKKLSKIVDAQRMSDYVSLRQTIEDIRKEEEFLTKKMMLDSIEEAKREAKELFGNVKD